MIRHLKVTGFLKLTASTWILGGDVYPSLKLTAILHLKNQWLVQMIVFILGQQAYFQGQTDVSFREGNYHAFKKTHLPKIATPKKKHMKKNTSGIWM